MFVSSSKTEIAEIEKIMGQQLNDMQYHRDVQLQDDDVEAAFLKELKILQRQMYWISKLVPTQFHIDRNVQIHDHREVNVSYSFSIKIMLGQGNLLFCNNYSISDLNKLKAIRQCHEEREAMNVQRHRQQKKDSDIGESSSVEPKKHGQ